MVDLDTSAILTDLGGPELVEVLNCLAYKISASELACMVELDWLSTVVDLGGSAAAAILVEVLTLIVGVGNGLVMAMDP